MFRMPCDGGRRISPPPVSRWLIRSKLAEIYRIEGRHWESRNLMETASAPSSINADAPGYPLVQNNLAMVRCRFREVDQAEKLLRSALISYEKRRQTDTREYGVTINNLGQVLESKKNLNAAASCTNRPSVSSSGWAPRPEKTWQPRLPTPANCISSWTGSKTPGKPKSEPWSCCAPTMMGRYARRSCGISETSRLTPASPPMLCLTSSSRSPFRRKPRRRAPGHRRPSAGLCFRHPARRQQLPRSQIAQARHGVGRRAQQPGLGPDDRLSKGSARRQIALPRPLSQKNTLHPC